MNKLLSIQEFYKTRYQWIPDEIRINLGHFNVFPLESPAIGEGAEPLPYGRREWYNIVLVYGGGILHCSGNQFPVKKHAIVFNNPYVPYGWDERHLINKGYYCIFNGQFLEKDKRIIEFLPFKTTTPSFYELTSKEADKAESLFLRMFEEVSSNYTYKYDLIKLLIQELLHLTMKSNSFNIENQTSQSASERLTIQFLELLERQFPIEERFQSLKYSTASNFAKQLNVHVNHLNKSIKETTEKTTTQIIKERIAQEAKTLIRYTSWNFSEIAYALGFKEVTHFNNFFKKATKLTPTQYRNI